MTTIADKIDEIIQSELILKKLDAIEYNASDLHENGMQFMKSYAGDSLLNAYNEGIKAMMNRLDKLSELTGLPLVGGSDSHHFLQAGCIKTTFNENTLSIADIKNQLKDKSIKPVVTISENLRVKASGAGLSRRILKTGETASMVDLYQKVLGL